LQKNKIKIYRFKFFPMLDPDPHWSKMLNPDLHWNTGEKGRKISLFLELSRW
jgi:hypothetical protein